MNYTILKFKEIIKLNVEKNVISLSGGKDSTALLLHALEKETENIVPVFADTGNEHKQTYDYLEYLERILNIKIIRVKAVFNQQIAKKREYIKHFWIQEDISQQIIEDALSVLKPTGVPFLDLYLTDEHR
ncbi:hypothetical protein DKL61_08110 [Gammaproteobacteria bacterium ESL0073]|nr:hypothetical protein DKL61_08110 [Gammaproteobacteria bacterium ESL0073]